LHEKEKLNGANFMDWYHNLRIVLRQEKTEYVLTELYPDDLPASSTTADHRAHEKRCDDALNVSCCMLATVSPDLQKQYEHMDAYTMIQGLRGMFENQARVERYTILKALFACKLAEGSLISPHVIKMMGYIETLTKLGFEIKDDLATNLILQSLPVSYESFIINFHMNGMEKTVAELHGMLKTAEDGIKKNPNHMMRQRAKVRKRFLISPQALSITQKTSVAFLLMRNGSTTTRRDIGSGTVRSIWRSKRRREVRLPLQV
jgi:hypothetical protein